MTRSITESAPLVSPGTARAVLFLLTSAACGPPAEAPPEPRPNLLVITVDTLRADYLGFHGDPGGASPNLDAFAARSTVFEDAHSSASWTLPSFASVMTGLPTSTHGCWSFRTYLDASFETLAETLLAVGYDTAAVVSHIFLGRTYGLHQGFVHFDDELVLELTKSGEAISSPAVTAKGLAFLRGKAAADDGRPWLLWLHYFDPHELYHAHPGFSEPFGEEQPAELYRGEIAFTDHHIGRVLEELEVLGLARDTVVVFTADHGEEFGEHGGDSHGKTLFVEQLHVPFVLHVPGLAPRRVAATVRNMDVLPTLLEVLDVPPRRPCEGESLVAALEGRPIEDRPVLSELARKASNALVSLTERDWKLLLDESNDRRSLYERGSDPGELLDVAARFPGELERLEARLEFLRRRAAERASDYRGGARLSLGVDELEDLEGIGYVGDE